MKKKRVQKSVSKFKIKSTEGEANNFPLTVVLESDKLTREYKQSDDVFFLCYEFSSWLENLNKGAVGGATNLLRIFLREKGYLSDE